MESILEPATWPKLTESRFASRIVGLKARAIDELAEELGKDSDQGTSFLWRGIAIIGLADDEGVRLNGGRPGAAEGPNAFRRALARYGAAESPVLQSSVSIVDIGDIIPGHSILETHQAVQAAVERVVEASYFPVGIGGGHDLTLPFVTGVASRVPEGMDGVYFDAHLDVREELGSGMPFRRLVDSGIATSLRCLGYDRFSNSQAHTDWFLNNGGSLDWFEAGEWPKQERQFVSVDLDVIDASQAPGVSASNPNGMSARTIAEYVHAAGRSPHVRCIDFMELSPKHDLDEMTARLAAHLFLCFIHGFTERVESMQNPSNERV